MSIVDKLMGLDFDLDTDAELFTCLRPEIVTVIAAAERAPLRYGGYDYEKSEELEDALFRLRRMLDGL